MKQLSEGSSGVSAPLRGFSQYSYNRQVPWWERRYHRATRLSRTLPIELEMQDCQFWSIEVDQQDPYVLYDRYGCILGEWQEWPSDADLLECLRRVLTPPLARV